MTNTINPSQSPTALQPSLLSQRAVYRLPANPEVIIDRLLSSKLLLLLQDQSRRYSLNFPLQQSVPPGRDEASRLLCGTDVILLTSVEMARGDVIIAANSANFTPGCIR